jgi:signal transduction histidine kinase/ligand-binding sensor domain-containing protein
MKPGVVRVLTVWLLLCGTGVISATEAGAENVNGNSTEFVVTTWQMPQGLPSDRVRDVLQTRDGYLWIATYNGAARFDGVRFRVFNDANTPALRNSLINCLFEDDQRRLWLGSDTGEITWRDSNGFHALETMKAWPAFPIVRFAQSAGGTIWALNRNGFILRIRHFKAEAILGDEAGPLYSDVVRDREGQVWAIRYGGRVVRLTAQTVIAESHTPVPPPGFRTIAPARRGGLWMRDEDRLHRWLYGQWVEERGRHAWGTRQAVVLYESVNGDVWVGTRDAGLFIVAPDGSEHHLDRAHGLAHDSVSCISGDREGNIWVGSDGGGLQRLSRRALFMVSPPDAWQHRPLLSVSPAQGGGLWVGTDGAGVYKVHDGQFARLDISNAPTARTVRTALEDSAGQLWVGTEVRERLMSGLLVQDPSGRLSVGRPGGGLVVGENGRLHPFTNPDPRLVMPSLFFAIYQDHHGALWMGTPDGLLRLQDGQWSKLGAELYRPEVRCITETPDGALWVGMRGGGVARYLAGAFTQYLHAQGLPYEYIWAILGDRNGSVWIGTPGAGLIRERDGRFAAFTVQQGLPSDYICSLLDDTRGNLWVGSYGGIFRVAKADLEACASGRVAAVNCLVLGASDGLASLEMAGGNQPAACRTADGRLWFASSGGLAMVDPERLRTNSLPPPVRIEEVIVDGKTFPLSSASGFSTKQGAPGVPVLRVPPGSGQIELRYTALSFCDPQRVRFRYRLENVEPSWVEAGNRRSAYYSHLAPRGYRFRVIACNNDGVWNQTGAMVGLQVLPFFWQTWWFSPLCWLGGASVVGSGVLAALRRRHRARIQALERARLVERERGRIARDLHDDLGSGLTDISMTSALGQEGSVPVEEAREYLREINQRANEMVGALDEIVWAVNPKNDDLSALTTYFCQFVERFVRLSSLSCRFEIPEKLPVLPLNAEQRHSLFLAFKEAIQNAVKHSGASELRLSIDAANGLLRITVQDNGRGFDPAVSRSGGNGLRNMQERLEQVGGACQIKTQPGQGVNVTFSIPAGPSGAGPQRT